MKNLILVCVCALCFMSLSAQDVPEKCATVADHRELQEKYPAEYSSDEEFEHWMSIKMSDLIQNRTTSLPPVVTLPVVFHVVHDGEPYGSNENIPDEQIFSQMRVLNEDFRKKEDTRGYNESPVGADTEIEFCLATVDPDGNPFNGINRVENTNFDLWEREDIQGVLKPTTFWDPERYFNVWVCNLGDNLAGYAQFPSDSGLSGIPFTGAAATDGIVLRYSYVGSKDDDDGSFNILSISYGRTATHEVGHWLGLRHIWGDGGCNIDDFCSDTPLAGGPSSGCPTTNVECGSVNMVQNYMDYSIDICHNIFTECQKTRMLTVLANSPRRANLVTSSTSVCTGTPFVVVASENRINCPGINVDFSDISSGNPIAWNWSFPGGNPASSTEQNPSVYYENEGIYDVVLEVTNDNGTSSATFTDYVEINSGLESEMFRDGFELLDGAWTIENPDGGITWEILDTTSNDGDIVYFINNFNYTDVGQRDGLISPKLNLFGRSIATLHLDYSYKSPPLSPGDSLIIYGSTDGGQTFSWLAGYAEDGSSNFNSAPFFNGEFYPIDVDEWCTNPGFPTSCIELDLSPLLGSPDARIKIENYNKNVNNMFIDNVRVEVSCPSITAPPLADFNATPPYDCDGGTVTFNNTSFGVLNNYTWSFPGGTPASSTETHPTVTYSGTGTYEVTLEATNPNGTDTKTLTDYITISDQEPTADFAVGAVAWNTAVFSNNSTEAVDYYWDFGDGNTSTEENPTHIYNGNVGDGYTVTLVATNGCGTSTFTQSVQTTSLQSPLSASDFLIFPNPSNGQFTVKWEGETMASANLNIYDMLGRQLVTQNHTGISSAWTHSLDLSYLPKGTYFLCMEIGNEKIYRKLAIH